MIKKSNLQFINLKNFIVDEQNILFQTDVGFKISEFNNIISKNQIHYQKFNNEIQQLILLLVDSVFPIIIADVCVLSFLYKIDTIEKYIESSKRLIIHKNLNQKYFYYRKFYDFFHLKLYCRSEELNLENQNPEPTKIYYRKDKNGNIHFYDYYKFKDLVDYLIKNATLEIDLKKSKIGHDKVKLNLQIVVK